MKVPFLKKYLQKASRASLEKQNPELASAMAKLERSGVQNDPQRAQAALSRLSAARAESLAGGRGAARRHSGADEPPAAAPARRS